MKQEKFLIIQTAFIGDVILATGLLEKLHAYFPAAEIDLVVRKGNESLFTNHPYLHQLLVWNKKKNKFRNLFKLLLQIRKNKYTRVINVQRFISTGLLTAFSGAEEKIGFDKNPLKVFFTRKAKHRIGNISNKIHEIERNHELIKDFTGPGASGPRLYPSAEDESAVNKFKTGRYITISPASVWFTKQYPGDKWVDFINEVPGNVQVYLTGGPGDFSMADSIINKARRNKVTNLCGQLSFLQSAALMQSSLMNYVNDSAPLHIASAVNAPVTAIFCSTDPAFGFTPLSDKSFVVETKEQLFCRPCGLHGKKKCPEEHFKCARTINTLQLLHTLK